MVPIVPVSECQDCSVLHPRDWYSPKRRVPNVVFLTKSAIGQFPPVSY